MGLADIRHTVEAGALLRTVSDFADEITFLGEALVEGRLTTEQKQFLEQHFAPLPETPDQFAARGKERYVGRSAIGKAQGRLADKAGADRDLYAKTKAYLNKAYDGYVHGYYGSAMELFTGRTMSFMMTGNESERHVCMIKAAVAGKLKEALNAFRMMAKTRGMPKIDRQCRDAFDALERSGEDSGVPCEGLA
jgi:hypothetical protein